MTRLTLEAAGYEVGEASDGRAGAGSLWGWLELERGAVGPKNAGHGRARNFASHQGSQPGCARHYGNRLRFD